MDSMRYMGYRGSVPVSLKLKGKEVVTKKLWPSKKFQGDVVDHQMLDVKLLLAVTRIMTNILRITLCLDEER